MKMAYEYIDKGLGISDVANLLHIPRCSFYHNGSNEKSSLRKGRRNSLFTVRKDGNETISVDNGIVVNEIEKLLSREFVCYGYMGETAASKLLQGLVVDKPKDRINKR